MGPEMCRDLGGNTLRHYWKSAQITGAILGLVGMSYCSEIVSRFSFERETVLIACSILLIQYGLKVKK